MYPIICKFSLNLPDSNADESNRIELRNRLTVSTLENLLRISLEGPENDFDFNAVRR